MNFILSFIIPVFNIDKYLSCCLDSIVKLEYKNIEIIIVNDGSQDSSGNIADKYAEDYDYIRVIHQKNQGVSAARNNGLKIAQGEYIWFVDGDDWLQGDMESVISQIKETKRDLYILEVIQSTKEIYNHVFLDKQSYASFHNEIPFLVEQNVIHYYPVNKIVKYNLIKDISFPEEIIVSEDFCWNVKIFKNVKSFEFISSMQYVYRVNRKGSATNQLSEKKVSSIVDALKLVKVEVDNTIEPILQKHLLIYASPVWFFVVPELQKCSKNIQSKLLPFIFSLYDDFCSNDIDLEKYNRGAKLFALCRNVFGMNVGIKIYNFLINIKRFLD